MNNILLYSLIAVGVGLGLLTILYGATRRFSRMSWTAWEIMCIFPLTLFVYLIPETATAGARFWLTFLLVAAATALVLGLGGLIRLAMLKKIKPAHPVWRFLDCLMGAVTAFVDYAMIVLVLASAVLPFFAALPPEALPAEQLLPFFNNPFWTEILRDHAMDLVLVSLFALVIGLGFRVGFARMIVVILLFAMTFGSVAMAFVLVLRVPLFASLAEAMAGAFAGMGAEAAAGIGVALAAGILSLVFLVVVFVLGYFIVKLVRHIRFHYFWGTVDGVIGAVLTLAVLMVTVCLFYAGISWISNGEAAKAVSDFFQKLAESNPEAFGEFAQNAVKFVEQAQEWLGGAMNALASSPIARAFILGNPISF